MASLTERIDAQIRELTAERGRIEDQAAENVAAVDVKLTALEKAKSAISKEVEAAYVSLLKLGLVKEL